MTAFVAMLRAVNVAGTGKLPMADLRMIGTECGFTSVRTFIASGNLLFDSPRDEAEIASMLEQRIERLMGKRVPLFVRNASEMAAVVARNPFTDDKPSRVMAHFISEQPNRAMIEAASGVQGERLALGPRAIYVSYGEGIGKTKLKVAALALGTARNMNSVAKLAALLA